MMASNNPGQPPSGRERREYYRITVTLPIRIQPELDQTEGAFVDKSINLSGGGIGVTITELYQPNDVLAVTLRLPEHGLFTTFVEVLRLDPRWDISPARPFHPHAGKDRDILIRHITRFQRDHLRDHYSA